jgi:hypothetical protein
MTTPSRTPARVAAPRLDDEALSEVVALLKGSDSAELKLSIPSPEQLSTIRGLPIDPVEAQPRQVFFFDTPDLALNKAGLVVRARRIQGGRGDTVVKLRPVVPDELPREMRLSGALTVEVDVIPGGYVCSASFKGKTTAADIHEAIRGNIPVRKIFSKEQRAFFAERAPAGIKLDDLTILGPNFALKSTFTPPELNRRFVAELWFYPDGSRILELSTKCLPGESFQVAIEARQYLRDRGVKMGGQQQTKTRAALDYWIAEHHKRLAAEAAPKTRSTRTRSTAGGRRRGTSGTSGTSGASRATAASGTTRARRTTAAKPAGTAAKPAGTAGGPRRSAPKAPPA